MRGTDHRDGQCRLASPQPAQTGTLARNRALKRGEPELFAFELAPEPNLGAGQASGVLGLVEPSDELRGHSQLGSKIRCEAGIPPLEAARNGPEFREHAPEVIRLRWCRVPSSLHSLVEAIKGGPVTLEVETLATHSPGSAVEEEGEESEPYYAPVHPAPGIDVVDISDDED